MQPCRHRAVMLSMPSQVECSGKQPTTGTIIIAAVIDERGARAVRARAKATHVCMRRRQQGARWRLEHKGLDEGSI